MYNNRRVSLGDKSMRINLYDLMAVVGMENTVLVDSLKTEGNLWGEKFSVCSKEPFHVYLKHVQKDIVSVVVDVTVVVERSCGRCLKRVSNVYDLHILRDMDVANRKAVDSSFDESLSETDEISYIEDCTLDVDMLVLDELYTVLPMMVLCKEDCKGICKVCGINLNESTCDCDQTVPDPRMAVFSDIFNQFKEV